MSQGGTLCWNGGQTGVCALAARARIRRSWRLRVSRGQMPQSKHGPCKNPHFPMQASPCAARAPNRPRASRCGLLAINFTGYPSAGGSKLPRNRMWAPRYTGTTGPGGARIPEPLSRQVHNRQHIITLALEATYISDELRSALPLASHREACAFFLGGGPGGLAARACKSPHPTTEIPHFTGAVIILIGTRLGRVGAIVPRRRPFFPPRRPTRNP